MACVRVEYGGAGYGGSTGERVREATCCERTDGVQETGGNRSGYWLVGWKRKSRAAWLGVQLEQACETWSPGPYESRIGIAKGFKTWGVVGGTGPTVGL